MVTLMATLSTKAPLVPRASRTGKPGTPFAFYFFMGTIGVALIYFIVLALSI